MNDTPSKFSTLEVPSDWEEKGIDEEGISEILRISDNTLFREVKKVFDFKNLQKKESAILKDIIQVFTTGALYGFESFDSFIQSRRNLNSLLESNANFTNMLSPAKNQLGHHILLYLDSLAPVVLEKSAKQYLSDKVDREMSEKKVIRSMEDFNNTRRAKSIHISQPNLTKRSLVLKFADSIEGLELITITLSCFNQNWLGKQAENDIEYLKLKV